MKYKRQKKVKTILKMFNFLGFEPPYTVVMDGTFSMAALNNKVNLAEQIPIYLGLSDPSAVKLCTTKCVLKELEKLGSYFYGALHILKQYPPIKCAHSSKKLKSAALCLQRLAESGFKCVLASQDSTLQEVTEKTRVPLLYLHSCTLILKKPSFFALEKCELQKVSVETRDLDTLSELKKQEGLLKEEEPVKISKKKLIKWENKLKKRQLYREKRRKARFESLHPTTEGHSEAGTNNQSEADKPRTRKRRNRKHKMKNCKRVSKTSMSAAKVGRGRAARKATSGLHCPGGGDGIETYGYDSPIRRNTYATISREAQTFLSWSARIPLKEAGQTDTYSLFPSKFGYSHDSEYDQQINNPLSLSTVSTQTVFDGLSCKSAQQRCPIETYRLGILSKFDSLSLDTDGSHDLDDSSDEFSDNDNDCLQLDQTNVNESLQYMYDCLGSPVGLGSQFKLSVKQPIIRANIAEEKEPEKDANQAKPTRIRLVRDVRRPVLDTKKTTSLITSHLLGATKTTPSKSTESTISENQKFESGGGSGDKCDNHKVVPPLFSDVNFPQKHQGMPNFTSGAGIPVSSAPLPPAPPFQHVPVRHAAQMNVAAPVSTGTNLVTLEQLTALQNYNAQQQHHHHQRQMQAAQMQQHLNMLHGAANNGTHHMHQNFPAGGLAGSYQNFLSMAAALQRPTAVASPPPPPMPPNTVGPPPHPPQMWSPHPPHQTMPQHTSNHMMHFANHHQQWVNAAPSVAPMFYPITAPNAINQQNLMFAQSIRNHYSAGSQL